MISVLLCLTFQIDTPMLASEWKRPGLLTHFTVVRKLDGGIFPMGFNKEVTDRNTKAGSNVLCVESRWKLKYHAFNVSFYSPFLLGKQNKTLWLYALLLS